MYLIHQLGLASFIHAPGRVNNDLLPQYLCLANLYLSSALSDGTSVSLLEAMACGLPVVVTKGYGNLEWVTPQQNGWLVEAGSPLKDVRYPTGDAAIDEVLQAHF